MNKNINLSLLLALLTLSGCSTIIGGNSSTAEASGARMGPSSLADGSTSLQNDKFNALTIGGDFTGNNLVIANKLQVESSAILTKVTVKGPSLIGGNLISNDATFKGALKVDHNIISIYSDFESGIRFNGAQLELNGRSEVWGNIISTKVDAPAVIVINHSKVKGNIEFAVPNGLVVIKNHAYFKGEIINGALKEE